MVQIITTAFGTVKALSPSDTKCIAKKNERHFATYDTTSTFTVSSYISSTCSWFTLFFVSQTYVRQNGRNTRNFPSILFAPQAIYLALGPYCTNIIFLYTIRPESIFLRLLIVYVEPCGFTERKHTLSAVGRNWIL